MNYLYFDIETLPAIQWMMNPAKLKEYGESRIPKNYKKPDSIMGWIAENGQRILHETALDWRYGNLLCIGYAVNTSPVMTTYSFDPTLPISVYPMLSRLEEALPHEVTWVGHNVLDFDLRWLKYLALRMKHPIAKLIPFGKWTPLVHDTMVMWSGPGIRQHTSLADIAEYLGLEGKGQGLNGSGIFDAWAAGEHDRIRMYCAQDVELTRQIHQRLVSE